MFILLERTPDGAELVPTDPEGNDLGDAVPVLGINGIGFARVKEARAYFDAMKEDPDFDPSPWRLYGFVIEGQTDFTPLLTVDEDTLP